MNKKECNKQKMQITENYMYTLELDQKRVFSIIQFASNRYQ